MRIYAAPTTALTSTGHYFTPLRPCRLTDLAHIGLLDQKPPHPRMRMPPAMGSRSTHHLRVKVVRVLCDGCERGAADVYCAHCKASSCKKCKTRLHAGAACKQSFDLTNCAAVLALCHKCRARPAHVRPPLCPISDTHATSAANP